MQQIKFWTDHMTVELHKCNERLSFHCFEIFLWSDDWRTFSTCWLDPDLRRLGGPKVKRLRSLIYFFQSTNLRKSFWLWLAAHWHAADENWFWCSLSGRKWKLANYSIRPKWIHGQCRASDRSRIQADWDFVPPWWHCSDCTASSCPSSSPLRVELAMRKEPRWRSYRLLLIDLACLLNLWRILMNLVQYECNSWRENCERTKWNECVCWRASCGPCGWLG